jgi:hypothetical protein
MESFDPIVCPQCKLGFAPGTTLCPVCKVGLLSGDEPNETPLPVILQDDLSYLEELRTAAAEWTRHLQDKLAQAGILYRTEVSDRRRRLFSIYVRPDDLARAKDIDQEVFTMEVPGSGQMRPVEDLDFSSCPGCGSRLGERDRECAGCGLVLFPTDGWTCSNCDEPVEVDVEACPHCGAGIDWSKA